MLREIKRFRESQKGFTLIELMATLAILAMVLAIAVPAVGKIMDNAEAQAHDSSIALIESSGELAYLGGLEFDDTERKSYNVPTLVDKGYLTLSEDDALYDNQNYVYQTTSGTFKFNGSVNQEPEPNPASDFVWDDNGDGTVTITDYIGTVTEVVIPSILDDLNVVSIGDDAFYDKGLTSVYIPDSVTSIGSSAFSDNDLIFVRLSERMTIINYGVFSYNNLTSVVIPDSVTSIGDRAFSDNNLTTVEIPDSVTSIGDRAFSYNSLTSVYIINSGTIINDTVFVGNSGGMIIHGVSGSTAETHASTNDYGFTPIN